MNCISFASARVQKIKQTHCDTGPKKIWEVAPLQLECFLTNYSVSSQLAVRMHPITILTFPVHNMTLCCAEAACSSTVRVARNVVRDIGEVAASSSPGLIQLASCSQRNAERDTHTLLAKRMHLSLYVPITELEQTGLPILRVRDWFSFLINRGCWHIVCGLRAADAARERAILRSFWARYRVGHAQHPVFKMSDEGSIDLERAAPLLYHGDEGRGRRRTPFLVTSYHSILGRGIHAGLQAQRDGQVSKSYIKLKPNFVGHSFTHRFLEAGFPKAVYSESSVFDALMRNCVLESEHMCTVGVQQRSTGETFFAVTLGVTGDWAWLHKAGSMHRSFNNTEKKDVEQKMPNGICHLCLAGRRGVPFECFHSRTPAWLRTCHTESPFNLPSPLTGLLHTPGMEAGIFRFDFWHSFHLGVGKAYVGSALALWSETFEGRSKDARFEALTRHYLEWSRRRHFPATLSKISKDTVQWESNTSFPMANWYKGSLTRIMCEYFRDALGGGETRNEMLDLTGEAAVAIHRCISGLYCRDVFLQHAEARELGEFGLRFLRRYATLAAKAVQSSRPLYILLPKMHALHHLFLEDLVLASDSQEWVVNPICYSVQQSEDFIGRNSRTARHVHPAQCSRRVLERHLKLAHNKYVEDGLLVAEEPE